MTIFLKDPAAVLDFTADYSDYLAEGETISTSTWSADPDGGLTIGSATNTGGAPTVFVSGGTAGQVVVLTNRIVTSAGRTDDRSFTIRIENR